MKGYTEVHRRRGVRRPAASERHSSEECLTHGLVECFGSQYAETQCGRRMRQQYAAAECGSRGAI